MADHPLLTVDVFTDRPLAGNPVAVVLDADDLPAAEMQRIAAWMNLSETTFVLRPTTAHADYRLRIFTPRNELPFAGHPTLGSAHAALESGRVPRNARVLSQECGAGPIAIRVEDAAGERRLYARVPAARVAETTVAAERLVQALGASPVAEPAPRVIDIGAVWLTVLMESEKTVRALSPDARAISELTRDVGAVGVTVFALSSAAQGVVVRSFAPLAGVVEDPVCGSGNAAVAAFVVATGLVVHTGRAWSASQGRELGRDGVVAVHVSDGGESIEIGGSAVTVVEGRLRL
jgi:PhzF family phenazine biosynthesis protein